MANCQRFEDCLERNVEAILIIPVTELIEISVQKYFFNI